MNLTAAPCANVSAPQIEECPVSIACKVKSVTNYGVHDMFLAEVVGVSVDDKYINAKGALDLEKAGILAYAHGNYYTLGRNLGSFGFSVNKAKLKQMQKMEKVEVEVKKPKKTSDEKDTGKRFPVRRSPFGRRPLKKDDAFRKTYKAEGDDRRVRDENSKPFNRDGGNRRDFRGDGQGKRDFSAGRRPVSGFGKKPGGHKPANGKAFRKA